MASSAAGRNAVIFALGTTVPFMVIIGAVNGVAVLAGVEHSSRQFGHESNVANCGRMTWAIHGFQLVQCLKRL